MIQITDKIWSAYIASLRKVNNKAANDMLSYLKAHDWAVDYVTRQLAIDYAYALSMKYGEAAAALACEMYDAMAIASGAGLPAAVPAPTATIQEVAKAINGTGKTGNPEIMADSVGRMVKMAAADTTLQNAIRDRVEWAWIPQGETCAFCIMLASQGWQPASSQALKGGHAEHIHANCDCMYAVRMTPQTTVEGYNPSQYKRMYYDAPLDGEAATPKNRLNAMRREFYKHNADEINEQKREAYAKQKERESSEAEETDVE